MATIKKAIARHNYIAAFLFLIIGAMLMILLSACGSNEAVAADPKASSATVDEEPTEEQAPPAVDNFIKPFGEVVTYEDGVSISVSAPTPFTPTNLDMFPLAEGETAVVVKVVLTNNSEKPLEPGAIAQANSGGKPATYLSNAGNPEYGDIGLFPTTTILPGQTLEWFVGFGVADVNDITVEIAPAPFDYDNAIFTNIAL